MDLAHNLVKTEANSDVADYLRSQRDKAGIHFYKSDLEKSVYLKKLRKKYSKKYGFDDTEDLDEELEVKVIVKEKKNQEKLTQKQSQFKVQVGEQIVSFSAEGIRPAKLSESDQSWLKNAQRYFIEAEENGKSIGSKAEYTSLNILYALWSTAEAYDLDPKRFLVQIYNESRFNPNLEGKAGERGIGQFKKSTAEFYSYDWSAMKAGEKTYAYQAKCSAELVSKIGEVAYNGKGRAANEYQKLISKRLNRIERLEV
jgi:hypothetical protein